MNKPVTKEITLTRSEWATVIHHLASSEPANYVSQGYEDELKAIHRKLIDAYYA